MADKRAFEIIASTMVVIPAQNEAADIGPVVSRARALGLDVLVVDDFSSDDTAVIARRAGARVVRLPFHAGSWAAMQTGIRIALENGYRRVVTLDGDGQHDPRDIPSLLDRICSEDTAPDVVVASCIQRGNRRRKLAWRVLRLLSGLQIGDLTSGFRVYGEDAMKLLASSESTLLEYQDVGVLLLLHRQALKVVEIDVDMSPRCHGQSRIFRSWFAVARYLAYSALISITRRPYPRLPFSAGAPAG